MSLRVPAPASLAYQRPTAVAETFDRMIGVNTSALPTGVGCAVALPVEGYLNTSVAVITVSGTAKAGGTHGWYALLDAFGNVLTATADQTDAATTFQGGEQPLNWVGQYANNYPQPTTLYLAVMLAATTMPTFSIKANPESGMNSNPPILCGRIGSGLTTPPVPGTNFTLAANATNMFHGWLF